MPKKFKLKTNLHFKSKFYSAGTEIELDSVEQQDYRIKNLLDKDLLVPIEEQETEETGAERQMQEDEEQEKKETSIATLKDVKGIGDSYARQIEEEFPYVEDLLDVDPADLARDIPGVSEKKARMIQDRMEMEI